MTLEPKGKMTDSRNNVRDPERLKNRKEQEGCEVVAGERGGMVRKAKRSKREQSILQV